MDDRTRYPHWNKVTELLRSGILTLDNDLGLLERGGYSHSETSFLTSRYGITVATPPLVEVMARVCGPTAIQPYMTTITWARLLADSGIDMLATGLSAIPHAEKNLVVSQGDGRVAYPDRTTLLVDLPPQRVHAAFTRCRSKRVVYLGHRVPLDGITPSWVLRNRYPAHAHDAGSELLVFTRRAPL